MARFICGGSRAQSRAVRRRALRAPVARMFLSAVVPHAAPGSGFLGSNTRHRYFLRSENFAVRSDTSGVATPSRPVQPGMKMSPSPGLAHSGPEGGFSAAMAASSSPNPSAAHAAHSSEQCTKHACAGWIWPSRLKRAHSSTMRPWARTSSGRCSSQNASAHDSQRKRRPPAAAAPLSHSPHRCWGHIHCVDLRAIDLVVSPRHDAWYAAGQRWHRNSSPPSQHTWHGFKI